jgi:DNA-binding Lrp family transcriptional regulator
VRSQERQRTPSLAQSPNIAQPTARDRGRPWHHASRFGDAAQFRPVTRDDRMRVWRAAELLDRRTHQPGRHGGLLGHSGLIVLRSLLFDFLNMVSGRLDPSYAAIAERTGLARSTVIEAMKRLVAAGLIERTRRLLRERVKAWCELAGRVIWFWRTRQTSNAYRVKFPLPDRRDLGDLAAPQHRPNSVVKTESSRRSETTPVLQKPTPDSVKDPGLRAILTRMLADRLADEASAG